MSVEGSNFQRIAASLGEIAKNSESAAADKSYVSIRRGQLSVEFGKSAKKSKTLNADELSKLIHDVTKQALEEGKISKETNFEEIVQGLEVLRGRVTARQDKINPVKKFIMELFHVEDKTQQVIHRINDTISILKQRHQEKEKFVGEKQIQIHPKAISPSEGIRKETETLATIFALNPRNKTFRTIVEKRVAALAPKKGNAPQEGFTEAFESLKRLKSYERAFQAEKLEKIKAPKNKTNFEIATKTPSKTAANMLLESIASENNPRGGIARQIKSQLGYTSAAAPAYLQYQQRLIFGFSVGQRQTIDELQKHGIAAQDLQTILEGGDAVTNMFYLANAIEESIANSSDKSPQYTQKLERIHADIMRSLPLALEISILDKQVTQRQSEIVAKIRKQQSPIETKTIAFSQKIQNQLQEMQAGQSLYIPVGTKDHAIMLRLEKTSDDKILPSIYNTGIGASSHQDFWNQFSNLFQEYDSSPVKVNYPPFSLNENFQTKLGEIFTNRMRNGSVEQLYENAKEKLGSPNPGPAKKEQINGVCSFQVLTAILEDNLESDHNQFQHDFLTRLGNEFSTIKEGLRITTSIKDAKSKELPDQEKIALTKKLHQAMIEDNSREIQRLKKLL